MGLLTIVTSSGLCIEDQNSMVLESCYGGWLVYFNALLNLQATRVDLYASFSDIVYISEASAD